MNALNDRNLLIIVINLTFSAVENLCKIIYIIDFIEASRIN